MARVIQNLFVGAIVAVSNVLLAATLMFAGPFPAGGAEAEPAPPADQTYTGWKRCASCHFDQYMTWKKDKHSQAFDLLTAKYQNNEKCLQCHSTGFGEPSGFKTGETALAGVTCEACHGPGSKHEEIAQPFAKVKKLTPEQEKMVRDSIWKVMPQNRCIECHVVKAHKPSETPPELRPKQ